MEREWLGESDDEQGRRGSLEREERHLAGAQPGFFPRANACRRTGGGGVGGDDRGGVGGGGVHACT